MSQTHSHSTTFSTPYQALTPITMRKRPLQTITADGGQPNSRPGQIADDRVLNSNEIGTNGTSKRLRRNVEESFSFPMLRKDLEPDLPTPPASSLQVTVLTMLLKLEIPKKELTKEEERNLKIRRASAERWKEKLQKPFPARKEINEAYNLKLMRHYPSGDFLTEANYIKPHIDKSARVEKLLKQFPVLSTSFPASAQNSNTNGYTAPSPLTEAQMYELETQRVLLKVNKTITQSEEAQRLAWKCFSSREKDRIDRGREAMLQSGLLIDDLQRESKGTPNGLPEWKKPKTGKFAREQRLEEALHRYL